MADASVSETTPLLRAWAGGDENALAELIPRVYRELRRLAAHVLRNEGSRQTLQATDLVHKAYLKLVDVKELDWRHRAHCFAVSATVMRRIVLDRAGRRLAAKRGRDVALSLKARIVELRFFVGLGVEETAAVVSVSPETVMRDWKAVRAWLLSQIRR